MLYFYFFCLATVALCAVLADGGSSTVFTVAFLPKVFADARPGFRERVLFIGTQFSILYTSMFLPKVFADARPGVRFVYVCVRVCARARMCRAAVNQTRCEAMQL